MKRLNVYLYYKIIILFLLITETDLIIHVVYWGIVKKENIASLAIDVFVIAVLLFIYFVWIRRAVRETRKNLMDFISGKTPELRQSKLLHLFPESNLLLDRLNTMINKEEMLKNANKQAEYLALQNQINPHFLYNTLEAIRGDALTGGMENLASVAEALSSFFRYTISDMQFLVTVDEELENVRNYFLIQQYRFGELLKFEVNFLDKETEIRSLRIPKLTLQPIVENAVFHGLEELVRKGSISITFEQTETLLLISVKDSGKGMQEKQVEELNRSLNDSPFERGDKKQEKKEVGMKKQHAGIALKNVSQRIKLLFGDQYGIYVFSTIGVGTNIKIILPRHSEQSYEQDDL